MFGDRCVFKCVVGYVIFDILSVVIMCGSSRKWEGILVKCNGKKL